jgi:hypothetical protein
MEDDNIYNILANVPPNELDEFDNAEQDIKLKEDFEIDTSDVKATLLNDAKPMIGKIVKGGISIISGIFLPAGSIAGFVMFIPLPPFNVIIAIIIIIIAVIIVAIVLGVWVLGGIIAMFMVFNKFNTSLITEGLGKFIMKLLTGFMLSWTYILSSNKK